MRALTDRKWKFFIIGLHRTGTTITTVILDSLENGVCWGEPHWFAHINDKEEDFFDGLSCDGWDVCGYKETYKMPAKRRAFHEDLLKRHIPLVDFFIVTFRDPIKAHSSMLAWNMTYITPAVFLEGYRRLDELASHEKGIPIVLEDLVDRGLPYLNSKLPFEIEGPLDLNPERGRQYMGDTYAITKARHLVHNRRRNLLTPRQMVKHTEAVNIWMSHLL